MSQNFSYPSSSTVTVAAVGTNLAPIPTSSILVAGENPSLQLQPLQTDASGRLIVSIGSGLTNPLPVTDAAAEASLASIDTKQSTILTRLTGSLVPTAYDQVDLTYVPSGNGVGQIQTAVYKLATVTVKTLTLSYDSSDRLTSTVAS